MDSPFREINGPTDVNSVPQVIRMGQTAIAASAAGNGLAVLYRDFPVTLQTAIWAYHRSGVESADVEIVHDRRTCEDAIKLLNEKRLVMVLEPCQLRSLARAVEEGIIKGKPSPTIFSCYSQADCEDLPIPTLVLRANAATCKEAGIWFNNPKRSSPIMSGGEPPVVELAEPIQSHLDQLLASSFTSYDECEVVRGLLKGAALIRANRETALDRVEAGLEDFLQVKGLLACSGATDSEGITDPLAVAMVQRVNAFLRPVKAKRTGRNDNEGDEEGEGEVREVEHCSITRKELVDLGNPSSGCVAELVKKLINEGGEGYQTYRSLGLVRSIEESENWPDDRSEEDWCKLLQPWTDKLVRTHFDSLRKQGIISAERRKANGPWVYRVPHELQAARSILANLPLPEPSLGQGGSPSTALNCPSVGADETN